MFLKPLHALSACFALGLVLSGCVPETRGNPQSAVVNAQAGSDTHLARGQLLAIELASNASTGYDWEIVQDGSPVLQPAVVPARAAPTSPPLPGAGGTSQWRFLAAQPGVATVRLVYRRPWEKEVAPARTATYRVTVD